MSLRSKVILILTAVVALWALGDHFMLRTMVSDHFRELGEEEALRGMTIVEKSLAAELRQLRDKARLFSSMPATAEFARGDDPAFVSEHLGPTTLQEAGLGLLYVCAADGTVLWGRIDDPLTREPISVTALPSEQLSVHHPLLGREEEGRWGNFLATEHGILLVSSLPIPGELQPAGPLEAAQDWPQAAQSLGHVVVGRFLDETLTGEGVEQAAFSFRLSSMRAARLDEREQALLPRITSEAGEVVIDEDEAGNLYAYKALFDIAGHSDILLRTNVDSDILARGKTTTRYLVMSTIGTSALIFLVLLRILQTAVIKPISALTRFATRVGETDDTSVRTEIRRSDEVGTLAAEFDRMLEEIERSRSLLVQTARQAGMSEIATGVLHNVGNVLNSVNVSAALISRKLEDFDLRDLERLVGVLDENKDQLGRFVAEDPRGKHLLDFLQQLTGAFKNQHSSLGEEIKRLREGIEHIAELVRSQQSYAGGKGVFEKTSLAEQIDAAVKICRQAYGRSHEIEFVREFDPDLPEVPVDKHRLMEILINLIQNARQAVADAADSHRRITLRVLGSGEERVRIEVEDNGVGIPAENVEKIFHHGFTTKQGGHGFGLHVSANAAKEMGSSLTVHSDGPGKGSRFTLELPTNREAPRHAA